MTERDMIETLEETASRRVLILDGAMGTMIQRHGLEENDFRGTLFGGHTVPLKGCNDILCLTRPDIIGAIHTAYLEAGADIIETDTFNANAVSMAEYGLAGHVAAINRAGADVARTAVEGYTRRTGRRAWVAGSVGPSNVSLAMSSGGDADGVDFGMMARAYEEQCVALLEGGVDLILLETVFDTLNAKAAIYGLEEAFSRVGRRVPLMISVTLTRTGRTLSGQTVSAFLASIAHASPWSVGLNCGFGAEGLGPWLERMEDAPYLLSMHPNAGLPDEMGCYRETPESMASALGVYLDRGALNIVGGCCGTTPEHIAAIARRAEGVAPRRVPVCDGHLRVSGLELLDVDGGGFLKVGERCNVAGSRKFLRLVNEGNHAEALDIASGQLERGAGMLDVNMDDGMLDASAEMERFVTMLGLEGSTAPAPLMIDSSDFSVIERALRRIQGRPVVNSISLKEGEAKFMEHARTLRRLGAAVVVMAFDEKGQADTYARRIEICGRAYRLLTRDGGFRGEDIIFDPNVLTVATGMPEHDRYALDFIECVRWIKANLPGARVSGGVSNLSFAFRGNNPLREAMHTVFLHHARLAGLDMAIVNPATSLDIGSVPADVREAVEDVLLCRRPDAVGRLTQLAARMKEEAEARRSRRVAGQMESVGVSSAPPSGECASDRLARMVISGHSEGLEAELEQALAAEGSAMGVVRNRLMEGMNRVGEAFGEGRMFLPQVVRSASVMKHAISWLTPHIEAENAGSADGGGGDGSRRIVLATVKGDVHDIGKNIVAVILRCSGFEVIDLGVMVPPERIIEEVRRTGARFVGLSGLITPSLSEMAEVARRLESEGMRDVALFVGGATTSALHTAVRIAPEFSGAVFHTRDAAMLPDVAVRVATAGTCDRTVRENRIEQERLRDEYVSRRSARPSVAPVRDAGMSVTACAVPRHPGLTDLHPGISDIIGLINWKAFMSVWKLPAYAVGSVTSGETPDGLGDDAMTAEARRLLADARRELERLAAGDYRLTARVLLAPARGEGDSIIIGTPGGEVCLPVLRRREPPCLALSDMVARAGDHIGVFAVTVGQAYGSAIESESDEYRRLLLQSLGDRMVEAATEWLHERVHSVLWCPGEGKRGVRPAVGYPSLPDQTLTHLLDRLLVYSDMGVRLTENGALAPSATTTGLILGSPESRYFDIGPLDEAAIADYARRRGLDADTVRRLLPRG